MQSTINDTAYLRALALRDLTDRAYGGHSIQLLIEEVAAALRERWGCEMLVNRGSRVVSEHENYDLLGYPNDAAAAGAVTPATSRTSGTCCAPTRLLGSLGVCDRSAGRTRVTFYSSAPGLSIAEM